MLEWWQLWVLAAPAGWMIASILNARDCPSERRWILIDVFLVLALCLFLVISWMK